MRIQLLPILAAVTVFSIGNSTAKAADLVFSIQQIGSDVVLNGSGSVNTAGLTIGGSSNRIGSVNPGFSAFSVGPAVVTSMRFWSPLTGSKPSIGTGSFTAATSGSGDYIGLVTFSGGGLYLPQSYVSGTSLSGTSVFANTTVAALGLTLGTYTWTWGSGANAGSAQMTISNVPEPSTYALGIIATGVMAAVARRRKALKG